jgi:hypothetical protein
MYKILLIAFLFVVSLNSLHAQDSTSRFGLGYSLGTYGGVFASWMTGCCRIEPQIGFSYSTTNDNGGFSISTTSATIGLGLSWGCNVEKNLNILYGPDVLLTATNVSANYKYLTTTFLLLLGPEYLLGKHFAISAALAPTVSFRGNPTSDQPTPYSPYTTSFTFLLGGNLAARYYF